LNKIISGNKGKDWKAKIMSGITLAMHWVLGLANTLPKVW
jgi:hypothetical protein